jgi:hypothetical protein
LSQHPEHSNLFKTTLEEHQDNLKEEDKQVISRLGALLLGESGARDFVAEGGEDVQKALHVLLHSC